MPRSPGQPIPANVSPAMRACMQRIDRDSDQWFLPNMRRSILGDAAIYVANPRIRHATLTAVGISTRDHRAVREALRGKMMCERTNAIALQRLASMLVGERRLSRDGAQALAAHFSELFRSAPVRNAEAA